MKKLVIKYVVHCLEQAIDSYVQSTPDKVDDAIWAGLKAKLEEYLEKSL